MGLFNRKRFEPEVSSNDIELEAGVALRRALAEGGVETTLQGVTGDLRLIVSNGTAYPVQNLASVIGTLDRSAWPEQIQRHADALVGDPAELDPSAPSALGAALAAAGPPAPPEPMVAETVAHEPVAAAEPAAPVDIREQIRTRILIDSEPIDLSYARPFAPGLVLALYLDFPDMVRTVLADDLPKLGLTLDELYRYGQAGTNDEPIDRHSHVGDGVFAIEGDSLFIASKAADLRHLSETIVGSAPHGIVFSIPDRHTLLYTVPRDPSIVASLNRLLKVTVSMAYSTENAPMGGLVSPHVFYGVGGVVEQIGWLDHETNTLKVVADGRFAELLAGL